MKRKYINYKLLSIDIKFLFGIIRFLLHDTSQKAGDRMRIDDDLRRELMDGIEDVIEVFNRIKSAQNIDDALEVYEEVKGVVEEVIENLNDIKIQEDAEELSGEDE